MENLEIFSYQFDKMLFYINKTNKKCIPEKIEYTNSAFFVPFKKFFALQIKRKRGLYYILSFYLIQYFAFGLRRLKR
jgi:hypothetical protein